MSAATSKRGAMEIDEIGVEIEDPFGRDANDLPVDQIGAGIDAHTKEIVDASLPASSARSIA